MKTLSPGRRASPDPGEPHVVRGTKSVVQGDEADLQLEAVWDFSKSGGSGKKPAKAVTRLVRKDGAWKILVLPQWVAR